MTPQLLAEVHEKLLTKQSLRDWLEVTDEEIDAFITEDLPDKTTLLLGVETAPGAVRADPVEDKVIAAAIEARASYIVSEDHHLLDLKEYQGIKIMNRVDFVAELDRLGVPPWPPIGESR